MFGLHRLLNINITKKLSLLFALVVIGFIGIGLTYWVVISNERNATQRSNLFIKYGQLVSDAQKHYFKVRRYENDFLLSISASTGQTYNNVPLDEHGKYLTLLEIDMENLRALSQEIDAKAAEQLIVDEVELPSEYQSQLVAQASTVIKDYKASFSDIVNFNQAVGFNENEGLRLKARLLLDDIENEISSIRASKLQSVLSKIRTHEKHILQSIDLTEAFEELKNQYQTYQYYIDRVAGVSDATRTKLKNNMNNYLGKIGEIVANKRNANEYTELYDFMLGPLFDEMGKSSELSILQNQASQAKITNNIMAFVALSLIAIASLISLMLYLFGRTITKPINTLTETIHEVNQGNLAARTGLERADELGVLSSAFDRLLDEKVTQLSNSEKTSSELNDSIISLLSSVSQISNKDFTVKAPVHENVTGALGDSLNVLTKETSSALSGVKEISVRVVAESSRVQRQSKFVMAVAEKERKLVEDIIAELRKTSKEMNQISIDATDANKRADHALTNTHSALEIVNRSIEGINGIRDTIRDTEKRIKRLGERSLEITNIVNLINDIAERTHILALNASMRAGSADEKGHGFAVVAEEVQRLAESAREATSEIDSLTNNIRIETKDAVTAMNTVIAQVAEGTAAAEQAGLAMRETQSSTENLVNAVNVITKRSMVQAQANLRLVHNSNDVLNSTRQTDQYLRQQMTNTNNLVRYSNMLLTTVGIFKLPVVDTENKFEVLMNEENKKRTLESDLGVAINQQKARAQEKDSSFVVA